MKNADKYLRKALNLVHTTDDSTRALIGKHIELDVLCLHPSIMATDLRLWEELPLNLSAGMVVAFKSSTFTLAQHQIHFETYLDLYNMNGDIILRIMIRRKQNKVFFNDRAGKSPLDGWGKEKSVKLNPADVDRWQNSGVTISVHDCSTLSKKQYRVLFDQTILYYFDRRFSGPAIKVHYSRTVYGGIFLLPSFSNPLNVFTYHLDGLAVAGRQDAESGR